MMIRSIAAALFLIFAYLQRRYSTRTFPVLAEESVPALYNGPYRPQIHFSPPQGFMNDPNGMFRDGKGIYHLYYQLNPTDLVAGNQHWGHATSADLYHWSNHPIAISPETPDEGIFSGSAVVDYNNTSGFFPNQTNGVVALYTLNTPIGQAQHLAYSLDGGYTFIKYASNPVISVSSKEFRDPKIIYHAQTSRWVAVVAYAQEYVVGIYTSPDLIAWTWASNFSRVGFLGLQYECPNLVPMPMLRNESLSLPDLLADSNIVHDANLWLMFISINPGAPLGGSASQYIPGYFNGTHFTPVDSAARLADFAKDNYAGQFFAEIPYSDPQISIQWASNWQYTNNVPTDTEGFRSFMALPRRHALANTTRTPYALFSIPAPIQHLYTTKQPLVKNDTLANQTLTFPLHITNLSGALAFSMKACSLPKAPQGSLNFTFRSSATGEHIRGGFLLPGDSTFFLDRSGVHGFNDPFFTAQFSTAHPVNADTGCFKLEIVFDRSIIEVFLDNGARSGTMIFFAEGIMDLLVLGSSELDEGVTIEAEVWGLRSTWSQFSTPASTPNMSRNLQREL